MFQLFNLVPRIDALRNIELPLVYAGVNPDERRHRSLEVLDRVRLSHRAKHTPVQLSGGQQQRIAIARVIINDPALIIADEPTGNLDSHAGEEIMEIFRDLNAEGKTIILVTHEREVATQAKRIIRMRDGKVYDDACFSSRY